MYTTHFKMFYLVSKGKCIKHKKLSTTGTITTVIFLGQFVSFSRHDHKKIDLSNQCPFSFLFVIRKLRLLTLFTNMLIFGIS